MPLILESPIPAVDPVLEAARALIEAAQASEEAYTIAELQAVVEATVLGESFIGRMKNKLQSLLQPVQAVENMLNKLKESKDDSERSKLKADIKAAMPRVQTQLSALEDGLKGLRSIKNPSETVKSDMASFKEPIAKAKSVLTRAKSAVN